MGDQKLQMELDEAKKRIAELEAEQASSVPSLDHTISELIFEIAPGGMVIVSFEGDILVCNREASDILGYSSAELMKTKTISLFVDPDDRTHLRSIILDGRSVKDFEVRMKHKNGDTVWVTTSARQIKFSDQDAVLISLMDITSYKQALGKLALDEVRFEALYTLSEMINEPESAILNFALEASTRVTDSEIGYIYFLNDDESELTLHAWSKDVMPQCSVQKYPDAYKVSETGLWGEAIRQRKPIITNDYEKSPYKRGQPEGHVPVKNHMNIPVFEGDKIVLLAGVGNKKSDYTEDDVRQLELVISGMWRIIQRKRADAALKAAHEGLEHKVRLRTVNLEDANANLGLLNIKLIKRDREREQARIALEESEERFRALFENNHAVMMLIDPATEEIVDANPAATTYYGYSLKDLCAMRISDINTLSLNEVKLEMHKAEKEKRSQFFFRHRRSSGEIRDVEVFSGPVAVGGRQLLYSIVHDITGRKQAEEALVRYERIVSSTPDMISLVDTNYIYRVVNDAYLEIFQRERDDILGKSVAELVGSEVFENVSKSSIDKALNGETVRVETWIEFPEVGKRFMAVTYHPVSLADGDIKYVSIDARDMTDLKKSEEALRVAADRLDLATDAGNIGIFEWDIVTGDLIWDHKMMELYQVGPAEFSGMFEAWRTRVHRKDLPEAERQLAEAVEQKKNFDSEFRIVWPNGEVRHIKAAGLIQLCDDGKPQSMTGVNWDVTTHRTMENELRRLATTDPLTGASNRRKFMERSTEEFDRCKRYDTPLTLLSLDIDYFKNINDTHGHPAGDEVLKELVSLCKATLRTTDVFGRMGGEEFSAVLTQTGIESGQRTAERLRQLVEQQAVETEAATISYTISIGLSELREDDTSMETILKRADDALYKAKNNGRNRVEID